jgi:hypothetical protein
MLSYFSMNNFIFLNTFFTYKSATKFILRFSTDFISITAKLFAKNT